MRISDWSSDVCSSDLVDAAADGLRFDVGGVQGQLQVAADAFDVGLARRAGDGDVAADAVDLQAAAGGADHADLHGDAVDVRSEEHTSELQSLMRISYDVFCWEKKTHDITHQQTPARIG